MITAINFGSAWEEIVMIVFFHALVPGLTRWILIQIGS